MSMSTDNIETINDEKNEPLPKTMKKYFDPLQR